MRKNADKSFPKLESNWNDTFQGPVSMRADSQLNFKHNYVQSATPDGPQVHPEGQQSAFVHGKLGRLGELSGLSFLWHYQLVSRVLDKTKHFKVTYTIANCILRILFNSVNSSLPRARITRWRGNAVVTVAVSFLRDIINQ
jgi:hypothetical protein